MTLSRPAVLVSALAAGALLTTGTTYAAFSDYADVVGNHVAAATVVVGASGGAAPALTYTGLLPGADAADGLQVQYAGSVPADIWVELEPGPSATAFCDGTAPRPGGALQIQVAGAGWEDYCSALGGRHFLIAGNVLPATTLTVPVDVRLADGTDVRYSDLAGVGGIVVHALQTGGQGFSDFARGTIAIGVGSIAPDVPQQCLDAGLGGFDASNTIILTAGDDVLDVSSLPESARGYLIVTLGGDDVITGSDEADCIIGGTGDRLVGGDQGDVLDEDTASELGLLSPDESGRPAPTTTPTTTPTPEGSTTPSVTPSAMPTTVSTTPPITVPTTVPSTAPVTPAGTASDKTSTQSSSAPPPSTPPPSSPATDGS